MSPKGKAKDAHRAVNTRLPSEVWEQLEKLAAQENRSIANTLTKVVVEYFATKKASK